MGKLTEEQIMGLMPKQKFYLATEKSVDSYFFVSMNPKTETPLVIAIPTSDYGRADVLRINQKRGGFFLNYEEALNEFIIASEEKLNWWKTVAKEHEEKQ